MVKLYVMDVTDLPDPERQPELLEGFSPERCEKIQKSRQEKARRQSMGAGLLLQKILAPYQIEETALSEGIHGKPMADGIEFNLSHSGNLVICAVSNQPVGCDAEEEREAPQGVAERFFSEKEQRYLNQCSDASYSREFFRLWTMKESYVKMTGEGLSIPMKEYEIVIDSHISVFRKGKIQNCHISEIRIPGYCISVCAESDEAVELIREKI